MPWTWKRCHSPFFEILDRINPECYKRAEDGPETYHRHPDNKLLVSRSVFVHFQSPGIERSVNKARAW